MTITLSNVNSASMTELKSFANDNDVFIQGDKRRKSTWVESITDFLIEGGELESIANEVDAAKEQTVITFTQSEAFTCAYPESRTSSPTQRVEDFISLGVSLTTSKANYADSLTVEAESEPLADEVPNTTSINSQADNNQLSFNQTSSNVTPMVMVLWTLAMIVVPAAITLRWLGNGIIKMVRVGIPLMDTATTKILEGVVWLTEILFGDSFDDFSESYLEGKHLLRN